MRSIVNSPNRMSSIGWAFFSALGRFKRGLLSSSNANVFSTDLVVRGFWPSFAGFWDGGFFEPPLFLEPLLPLRLDIQHLFKTKHRPIFRGAMTTHLIAYPSTGCACAAS